MTRETKEKWLFYAMLAVALFLLSQLAWPQCDFDHFRTSDQKTPSIEERITKLEKRVAALEDAKAEGFNGLGAVPEPPSPPAGSVTLPNGCIRLPNGQVICPKRR